MIPKLEQGCGSWVVTRKATGEVIGEFFDASSVAKFNPEKVVIETFHQYLCRINRQIKSGE